MINPENYPVSENKKENYPLPWIKRADGTPYFITEDGTSWAPVGQNDAINWPELNNLFKRKNLKQVEEHLLWLKDHGVTVLRLMLEYSQNNYRYIERPVGKFQPNMVQLWDDLFSLCERLEMRILLTPVDTFWMWIRWKHHPFNKKNGGPCAKRGEWLICRDTIEAFKNRLSFAVQRWGGSGALFAWDLWNEIHPAHCGGQTEYVTPFITELSRHVRSLERELYGRSHLQTVSIFGPQLNTNPEMADAIFRHPELDFANSHFYDAATINNPKDTVGPAIVTGKLVREALEHIRDNRPFFDSEHGPIHSFKDRKRTLPEPFDDEYFRHIQWAHLASGGAGGGMRWPNRNPHVLTAGMRREQLHLSRFLKLIDWNNFKRKNLNLEVKVSTPSFSPFCCGDKDQAVLYLLRNDSIKKKQLNPGAPPVDVKVILPELSKGSYRVTEFDTGTGTIRSRQKIDPLPNGNLLIKFPSVITDLAVAVQRI